MSITQKIFFGLLFALSTVIQADTITIPGHFESDRNMVLPKRGISMDQVLSDFGEPVNRNDAIGDPPITEWDYEEFRVYFEFQTVLHTVDVKSLIMPK